MLARRDVTHNGERLVQAQRGFGSIDAYVYAKPGIPPDMVFFLTGLPFLPVASLDSRGRPWTSLLCGPDGRIGFADGDVIAGVRDRVCLDVAMPEGTPIKALVDQLSHVSSSSISEPQLFAMLGVDLSNRRRNKFDGLLLGASRDVADDTRCKLFVQIRYTVGNCPKYINIRQLQSFVSEPKVLAPANSFDYPAGTPLPDTALSLIHAADVAFLSTRHTGLGDGDQSKVAVNIRGGRRGFIQVYWDKDRVDENGMSMSQGRTCVVLPDYSGNRFMQSLGNLALEGDRLAGLALPVWGVVNPDGKGVPTSVLYLTGETELLSGEAAAAVMRGVRGLVKIWVTGWTLVQGGVPLAVALDDHLPDIEIDGQTQSDDPTILALSDANAGWSPYNPSLRVLNGQRHTGDRESTVHEPMAHLIDAEILTDTMGKFVWRVSSAPQRWKLWKAGQHVILDMSSLLIQRYQHMSRTAGREKDLNDDGVRSYTITSVCPLPDLDGSWTFSLALRLAEGGTITPRLFNYARELLEWRSIDHREQSNAPSPSLSVPFLGVEGECTLPIPSAARASIADDTLRVAYLASGIGITPLLAHLSALCERVSCPGPDGGGVPQLQVVAVVAARANDVPAMDRMIRKTLAGPQSNDSRSSSKDVNVTTLDVHIHFLTKTSSNENAEMDFKNESAGSIALSAAISLKRTWHTHVRLTESSLMAEESPAIPSRVDQRPEESFRLPVVPFRVADAEAVYLCGAAPFEKMARLALQQAGIGPDKIKSEDFSF